MIVEILGLLEGAGFDRPSGGRTMSFQLEILEARLKACKYIRCGRTWHASIHHQQDENNW